MQRIFIRRLTAAFLCAMVLGAAAIPAYAWFGRKSERTSQSSLLTKNVVMGQTLTFSPDEFPVPKGEQLSTLTVTSLPQRSAGLLLMGGEAVSAGSVIRTGALDGLSFTPVTGATAQVTEFCLSPTYASGTSGDIITVQVHLLEQENQAPIAENLSLQTYKNVALTGYFQAADNDGDQLTYQLTSTPARGSVAIVEDGSGQFVYTPYENKTGRDSFTYVAVDEAGNLSNPAKVTLRIEKPATSVMYADLAGHPAHRAAVRLAEEKIFVGECVNGVYVFAPDTPVSRSSFLMMAMSAAGLDPLTQVSLTGFSDDDSIPVWSKGYVSSALMSGAVSGCPGADGGIVFDAGRTVTLGEASVMLDNLLNVSDVAVQTWSSAGIETLADSHWAMQSAVDLACAGVIRLEEDTAALDAPLTRADAAQLLCGGLDLLDARSTVRLY